MLEKKTRQLPQLSPLFTPCPHLQRSANDVPQQLLIFFAKHKPMWPLQGFTRETISVLRP